MMSMNSGTTDSSMLNSDNLDKLSSMLNAKKISFEDTTRAICDFAHNSFDMKLDYEQIIQKLNDEHNNFNKAHVDQIINHMLHLDQKIKHLNKQIHNVSQRINIELKP